jgi:hypothetical protein
MNIDAILEAFNRQEVDAILIGGMNFMMRHQPVLTFDIDFWVKDTGENLAHVADALREVGAEWGSSEKTWGPLPAGYQWLLSQQIYCLTTQHGAVDIFRSVEGLADQYEACKARSTVQCSTGGQSYWSLSERDMLACQLALPEGSRRLDRVAYLQKYLEEHP